MRIGSFITAILFLIFACSNCVEADRFAGSIQLSANPGSLAADGKSICIVNAQVRDRQGNLAADGTEVRFSSSLGVIEDSALTRGGVARVKLVAGTIKGACVITATWVEGQAVAQTNIAFGDRAVGIQGPSYMTVEADDYIGYSSDKKILDAVGNVRIKYRSLRIEAFSAQVDLDKHRIVAKGDGQAHPIKIQTTNGVLEGERFSTDIAGTATLISSENGIKQIDMSSATEITSRSLSYYQPEDFDFADLSESHVFVKSKRATVFLGDRIQFEKAKVFLDGKQIISLPLYVLSMNGYEVDGDQYVGYGDNGITLNLPVYYSLSPSSTGALLVTHGATSTSGLYGSNVGWALDMRQKYATDKSQGLFALDQITSNDWGAHISHSQQFGQNTQTYAYVDFPEHKDLFGNFNIDHTFNAFNLGMNVYGSKYSEGMSSLASDLYAQTHAKPVGKYPFRYTVSSRVGYSETDLGNQVNTNPVLVTDANGVTTLQPAVPQNTVTGNGFTESLQGNIYSMPLPLSKKLSLSTSMSLGYLWSPYPGDSGISSLGSAVLDWKIAPTNTLQLSYRFADRSSIYTSSSSQQSVSGMWRYSSGNKWLASLYAIQGLDYSSTNIFTDLSYKLSKPWRIGIRTTWNKFGSTSYNDVQFALGRMFGQREFTVVYSKTLHKFMFQLGSGGF